MEENKAEMQCPLHGTQKEFYCFEQECQTLVCAQCLLDHQAHKFVHLTDVGKQMIDAHKKEIEDGILRQIDIKKKFERNKNFHDKIKTQMAIGKQGFEEILQSFTFLIQSQIQNLNHRQEEIHLEFTSKNLGLTKEETENEQKINHSKLQIRELQDCLKDKNISKLYLKKKDQIEKKTEGKFKQMGQKIISIQKEMKEFNEAKMLKRIHKDIDANINEFMSMVRKLKRIPKVFPSGPFVHHFIPNSFILYKYDLNNGNTQKIKHHDKVFFSADSVQIDNRIFLSGGHFKNEYYQETFEYNNDTNDLEERALMRLPKGCHTLVALDRKTVFSVGGENEQGVISSCEKYAVQQDDWSMIPSLNQPKWGVSVCSFQKHVLIAFGGFNEKVYFNTIERFNAKKPELGWLIQKLNAGISDPFVPRSNAGCIQISRDSVLIFGGVNKSTNLLDESLIYYPKEKKFKKQSVLVKGEKFYQVKPIANNNKIYCIGYEDSDIHVFKLMEEEWDIIKEEEWINEELKSEEIKDLESVDSNEDDDDDDDDDDEMDPREETKSAQK